MLEAKEAHINAELFNSMLEEKIFNISLEYLNNLINKNSRLGETELTVNYKIFMFIQKIKVGDLELPTLDIYFRKNKKIYEKIMIKIINLLETSGYIIDKKDEETFFIKW